MKSIPFLSVFLLFSFLFISLANCSDMESANELYVKSGLEKNIFDVGPALLTGYKHNYNRSKNHTAHEKKIYKNIEQIIDNTFNSQMMKEFIVTGLMKDINEPEMKQILSWLNSSVGKEITLLEEKAGSTEGMEETQRYIRNIKTVPVSKERVRLIKELNSSMNISETTLNIALSTQFALTMTLNKEKKKLSSDDIRKLYEESKTIRSQLEEMVEHQVHGSLLYTYQNLPDDYLEQYISFLKSESGKKYSTVTSSYVIDAITKSCLQFAGEISQL